MSYYLSYFFGLVGAITLVGGCTPMAPRMDSKFGDAMNIAKAQQTINPDASANRNVTRMDGQAAKAVFDNYEKGYKTPVKESSIFTIGIGGGSSGGGGQ